MSQNFVLLGDKIFVIKNNEDVPRIEDRGKKEKRKTNAKSLISFL